MENKRQVKFSTLFGLLREKRRFLILGTVFTCVSVFILSPAIYFLSTSFKENYQQYNVDLIKANGVNKKAKLVNIEALQSETINNRHPQIINYQYKDNGQLFTDKFETMDFDKLNNLNIGDSIEIKVLNHASVITNLKPFNFPFYVFYILPVVFFTIGVPFLLIWLVPALKRFNLYKNGLVKTAEIFSMLPRVFQYKGNNRDDVLVVYSFIGSTGIKIWGNAAIDDLSFLNNRKVGDKIKIFVSENDETKYCIIPDKDAVKNNWDLNYD